MAEVATVELLEVQLVNAMAPFILNARLKPLMLRTPGTRQAHRQRLRRGRPVLPQVQDHAHPHTNMAKAALNMMTRTAAADYHADGIHMNSVDTGWVTDEDPVHRRAQTGRAPLPSAARHRRRRRPHRGPHHRRPQHRPPPLGQVSERLQRNRLVTIWPRRRIIPV